MSFIDDCYRAGLRTSNYADNPYQWGTYQYNQFERAVTQRRKALAKLNAPCLRKPSYRDKSKYL